MGDFTQNINSLLDKNFYLEEVEKSNENVIIDYDNIIKFPRTKHIFNLGAMTRDDLIFTPEELDEFLNMELLIEEKIDGSNIGIFLNKTTMKIMVHNRSQFINSKYHEQFKLLDVWIENHSTELFEIFQDNEYILYGEWIYLKHSIHYDNIPDYFILFDIYNRKTKNFLSRNVVNSIIEKTTLKQVPIIAKGKFNIEQLKKFVMSKSNFYDGLVEGIYVRAICNNVTKFRGKIVRHNFTAGNENWNKNKFTVNIKKC